MSTGIGRTGRAAATGEALSLVCVDEHKLLRDIEKLLKIDSAHCSPVMKPDPSIKAEPIQNGRQQCGGGGRGQGGGGRGQQQPRRGRCAKSASAKPAEKPSRRLGDAKPAGANNNAVAVRVNLPLRSNTTKGQKSITGFCPLFRYTV